MLGYQQRIGLAVLLIASFRHFPSHFDFWRHAKFKLKIENVENCHFHSIALRQNILFYIFMNFLLISLKIYYLIDSEANVGGHQWNGEAALGRQILRDRMHH